MTAPELPGLATLVPPTAEKPYVPEQPYVRPLERNMKVGPLWVSSCRCPACGDLFAHVGIVADDASPTCYRCQYATAWPTETTESREARARIVPILAAYRAAVGTSGASQQQQHDAWARFVNSAVAEVGALLDELARVFGPPASGETAP